MSTVATGEDDSDNLVPLFGGKSKVWTDFGFRIDKKGEIVNKKEVICHVCKSDLLYSGSTTNMMYHIHRYHNKEYEVVVPAF